MKTCSRCGVLKSFPEFVQATKRKNGVASICLECNRSYMREYKRANFERVKDSELTRRYGITYDEYLAMVESRSGKCDCCGRSRKLYVDHCHASGAIRFLMCSQCNTAIGLLGDDADLVPWLAELFRRKAV